MSRVQSSKRGSSAPGTVPRPIRWWENTEAKGELDDDQFETQRRRNWLEAARQYDPQASLGEELTVRLLGALADRGGLPFSVRDQLLKPLLRHLTSAEMLEFTNDDPWEPEEPHL